MVHVISFSGGVTSWAAGRVVRDRIMRRGDELVLLFADTLIEADDVYQFLHAAAANIGRPITRLCDGRTPWQVFRDKRFLGNSRIDPCSKILKRDLLRQWQREHCDPHASIHHVGYDASEGKRFARYAASQREDGWVGAAPLIEHGITKDQALRWARDEGLPLPHAYREGFSHANCGGKCIKAGQGHWANLWRTHPDRYLDAEHEEQGMRTLLNKDIAILKERVNGVSRPMTLREFRRRIEQAPRPPLLQRAANQEHGCE